MAIVGFRITFITTNDTFKKYFGGLDGITYGDKGANLMLAGVCVYHIPYHSYSVLEIVRK